MEADHLAKLTPHRVVKLVRLLGHEDTVQAAASPGLDDRLERFGNGVAAHVMAQLINHDQLAPGQEAGSSQRQLGEVLESGLQLAGKHCVRVKADPARGNGLVKLVGSARRGELEQL